MILPTVSLSESTISFDDLTKVGIQGKRLVLANVKISDLTKGMTTDAEAHIADLDSTIEEIYEGVNTDVRLSLITFAFSRLTSSQYDLGARMTVDTILLALRKISLTQQRDIAIFPTAVTRG